ncbi:MAG TPA: isopeptide-forming domain-containing fimbrial protein [Verrucomicrobiae bacterium]|nr:isopeptide-forming domain-containing fimbrial protein [Verrucomicrobiae bacterium]
MTIRKLMKNPFKGLARRLLGTLAVAGFAVAGAVTATASGPVFNNLPEDYDTLQVAKSGENWSRSTTAQIGDTVNLMVWDHNTVPDTTAHNVRVKVTLPTAVATSHTPSATVSADNADSVTGTSTISVGTASKIGYIPGTAKLYRNVGGQMQQVNWPAGVNPDDVVRGGVNLGDQRGCWTYAQAVLIQVKVEGGNPAINTNKRVQLDGGAAYSESVDNAQPNDVVNFKIFMENTGNATGVNPKIVDTLDSHLTYVPNSSIVKTKVNNEDKYTDYPDAQIQKNGQTLTWSFPDMAARPDAALYLQFQARLANKDAFPVGITTIQNCATAKFDGVSKDTNCVIIKVTRSVDEVISFSVKKEVKNLTLDSKWYDAQTAPAGPGDALAYSLTMVNTGNTTAKNVTLKDILPAGVTFDGNVMLYNRANPNGVSISGDAIVKGGHVFSEVVNGSDNYQTIVFRAKVTENCSSNMTLVNKAQVIYGGQVKAEDIATVLVSCVRGLVITKDVLNPATGQYQDSVSSFHEGDVIVFRINVQNTGNTTVTNPIVRDVLPQYTAYQANSLTIDGEFMSQAVQDAFWNGGIKLTNLTPGMGKTLTFRLKVTDCPPFGDTVITNRAFAKADHIAEISDTATATVKVRRPDLP